MRRTHPNKHNMATQSADGSTTVKGDENGVVNKYIMSSWLTPAPGDGDKDPLMCGEKGWHFGLFDGCCNGGALRCCQRWYCGSCMYGRAMALGLNGNCCLCCCMMGYYCGWCAFPFCRAKLREKYGIQDGNCCLDCVKCWLCPPCTLQQFFQEVNQRENVHIGPFGDAEGTWNVKIDCGSDLPNVKLGTELKTGSSMER